MLTISSFFKAPSLLLSPVVSNHIVIVNENLDVFPLVMKDLSLTHEMPSDDCLQCLDIKLTLLSDHVCWFYMPWIGKGLLPYKSGHSKAVKRAVPMACLQGALMKSCHHYVHESFVAQLSGLMTTGFPLMVLMAVAESWLQRVKCSGTREGDASRRKNPVVLSYVHRLAHNMKNVANSNGVPVVFSAPRKLAGLCPKILKGSNKATACLTKHGTQFVQCATEVVYSIPLICGKVYVGQSGHCVNDRLREHQLSIRKKTPSHLSRYCFSCEDKPCQPLLKVTRVLSRNRQRVGRELIETFFYP